MLKLFQGGEEIIGYYSSAEILSAEILSVYFFNDRPSSESITKNIIVGINSLGSVIDAPKKM